MYSVFRPFLFRLEAELAHRVGMGAAQFVQATAPSLIDPFFSFESDSLRQRYWGSEFVNPIGLAAGFDKNARLVPFWRHLGFGFVEIGSVSARPSRGNDRPRAFRLTTDHAIINRMGLNNHGADRVGRRLRKYGEEIRLPVGINLAKSNDDSIVGEAAIEDFLVSFEELGPLANYVALNISCPNTADGKTFEDPRALDELLRAVMRRRKSKKINAPILIKLSPPLSERVIFDSLIDELVHVALAHRVDGLIATNTAADRSSLQTASAKLERIGAGGLSGRPLERRSTLLVRYLYRKTKGELPIIGVGGVDSAEAAYAKIRSGACLVQLYTGLVYEGPGLIKRIKTGLTKLLERDGFATIKDAIGMDA